MKAVKLVVGGIELKGTLQDGALAEQVCRALPCEAFGESWGGEVYFPIRLAADNTAPVLEVKVGDIAYWPDGPDLCLFFGPTPKSTGPDPVVTSPVTVVGTFECDPAQFERIERQRRGIAVRVEPCE